MSFSPIPNQRTFTIPEVAQMLGVKQSTVRAWISRKEIRAYKIDNRRYISHQQIAEFFYQRNSSRDFVDMTYANGPIR